MQIRMYDQPGQTRGYKVVRDADGYLYDFSDGTFKASPTERLAAVTEGTGGDAGKYTATLDVSAFQDGDYILEGHNAVTWAAATRNFGGFGFALKNGSAATLFPGPGGVDPLAVVVPATYAPNTVGWLVGHYLDAAVSAAGGAADPAAIVSAVFAKAIGPLTFGDIAKILGAFGGGRIYRDGQNRIHISEAGGTADVIVMVQTATGRTITLYL